MRHKEARSVYKSTSNHFMIFGCLAFAYVPYQKHQKLYDKSVKCIFPNASDSSKSYMLHDPNTQKIIISRDVVFDENKKWRLNSNKLGQQTNNLYVNLDKEEDG